MEPGTNEILAGAAFFVGTVIATVIAYVTKKPPPAQHDAVLASVGLELGSKQQQAEMNEHLKSISESLRVLADRKRTAFEDRVLDALERLDEVEKRMR